MKFREMKAKFDRPRAKDELKTPEYRAIDQEMKRLSYWIDHTTDPEARKKLIQQHKALKKQQRTIPCHPQTNKKFGTQMIGWSACAAQRKNAQFSKMKSQPFYPASST